jgi:DNA-binding transcriptional regulator WhiA
MINASLILEKKKLHLKTKKNVRKEVVYLKSLSALNVYLRTLDLHQILSFETFQIMKSSQVEKYCASSL